MDIGKEKEKINIEPVPEPKEAPVTEPTPAPAKEPEREKVDATLRQL